MEEAGWVGLGVVPTFDKFPRALEAGTSKHMAAAGATSGRQFGDAAGKSAGSRFGTVFKTAAKGALIGAGLLGAAAVKFGADSVSAASDIAESTNKLDQVFGKASGRITKFSGKAAEALGQTDLQARNAAATFGIYGKAAKMTEGQNAKFSKRMTTLASDLASFHNTEPEVAIEALGSALRGEAEPMRQFGVLLDDASMRTEAVRLGLIKTTKEALTPQNKVLAAQALIFKQTKDAQGDFTRTSDGLANQQRILKARFEDTKIAVGTALLPAVNDAVRFINDHGIPVLEDFGDWFNRKGVPAIKDFGGFVSGTLVPALGDFKDKAGPLAKSVLPEIRDAAADVRDVFKDLAPFVEDAFDAFNNLPDGVKKGIVIAGGALALKKLVGGRNGNGGGSGGVTIAGATKDALKTKAGGFLADKLLAKFAKPLPVFVVNQAGTTDMLTKKGTMGALAKWGAPAAAVAAAVSINKLTEKIDPSVKQTGLVGTPPGGADGGMTLPAHAIDFSDTNKKIQDTTKKARNLRGEFIDLRDLLRNPYRAVVDDSDLRVALGLAKDYAAALREITTASAGFEARLKGDSYGSGVQVNIGEVKAHDYDDFMKQTRRRAVGANGGGVDW